ncbi:DUF7940 domain-containing protein [Lysobacter fragariae]
MQLIHNWRDGWRFYSTWLIACLGALPDLYNLLAGFGAFDEMPEAAKWTVRVGAVLALVGRFIQQHKPEQPPRPLPRKRLAP